jgi:hypothetical protein
MRHLSGMIRLVIRLIIADRQTYCCLSCAHSLPQ